VQILEEEEKADEDEEVL